MNHGQGAISPQSLPNPTAIPIPGPPFALTSADNGLSVDPITGRIVLGNDAALFTAALLSNRDLPLGAFKFDWLNGTNRQFSINPTLRLYQIGDIDAAGSGGSLVIDDINGFLDLGSNVAPGGVLELDFTGEALQFFGSTGTYLSLSGTTDFYSIGDVFATNNGTVININDDLAFKLITLKADNGVVAIDGATASKYMWLDIPSGLYSIGDIDAAANGTTLKVDDVTGTLIIANSVNNAGININGVAGFTGTVTPVNSITVNHGIVTAVT